MAALLRITARGREFLIAFFIFAEVLGTHFNCKVYHFSDSRWSIYAAMSLIREGNLCLDEYRKVIPAVDYRIYKKDGHLFSRYPVNTSLVALPLVFIIDKSLLNFADFDLYENLKSSQPEKSLAPNMEVFIASFFVALSAVVIYFISRLYAGAAPSLWLVFIFAFCTSAFSTASRALWQHGPSMLFLSLALYFTLALRDTYRKYLFIILFLVLAYFIRPVNFISLFFISLLGLTGNKKYRLPYLVFLAGVLFLCVVLFSLSFKHIYAWFNLRFYINVMAQKPIDIPSALGNLISPQRGLFIYMPVFLFSFYGMWVKIKEKSFTRIDGALALIIVFHWLVLAMRPFCGAGHSFGPRYFTDIIPFFIYFLIFSLQGIFKARPAARVILLTVFLAFNGLGFFIHYRGATSWKTWAWNALPVDVDKAKWRLWDWRDIQFLR